MTPTDYRYTGQLAEPSLGLDYYVARWYDSQLAHFTSPDSMIPDPGKAKSFDRYAYVNNNPINLNDPTGHCWGIASGLRNLPGYGATCGNIDNALKIVQSDKTSISDKAVAGGYIATEVIAHLLVVGGTVAAICGLTPSCAAAIGAGAVSSTTTTVAATTAGAAETANVACGRDMCSGEIQEAGQAFENAGLRFTQNSASPEFNIEGNFKGETIGSMADKIRNGAVDVSEVSGWCNIFSVKS